MFGDDFMLALCMWREARGDGAAGMTAVGCVVRNRVTAHGSGYYSEIVRALQFSSITAKGDPQLTLYPQLSDGTWGMAQTLAKEVISGPLALEDITGGAQFYYATTIPLPSWAEGMTMTCQIGRQRFYKQ